MAERVGMNESGGHLVSECVNQFYMQNPGRAYKAQREVYGNSRKGKV